MRSSLIVSTLFFVAVSSFVTFKTVSGSEAGLTSGTPVLSAAELRAMAPEPLPVVADPVSAVNVSPKGVAQAEQMTETATAERVAKAAAKKAKADAKKKDAKTKTTDAKKKATPAKDKVASKDAKKTDAKKTDAKKADAKKADAKKTDVAKKSDAKKDAKTKVAAKPASKDAKDAKKSDSKKSDVKVADAKKAKKDSKEAGKKSDAKTKVAAKAKAKPVEVAQVEESDEDSTEASASDEGSSSDADEAEEVPAAKPAKHATKSDKASKADKSKKPAALAKSTKASAGAAKLGKSKVQPADEDSESEDVVAAPAKPAADPSVIAAEDQEKFKAAVTKWLQSLATIETGGSADVKLSGMHYGKAQGRDAVLFERAALVVSQVKLQTTHVKKATIELRELALDAAQLKSGSCALVNTPTVVPDLTLEHSQVQAQLGKNNIKSPNIAYEGQQMVFTGKAPFMFFSIPFKMAGKFERNGNNIAFRIAELEIKGSAAGADRRASVQAKLENMIKLENVLAPIGAPGAPVRGGKVNIEDGASVVYSTAIDGAVPAE